MEEFRTVRSWVQEEVSHLDFWSEDPKDQSKEDSRGSHPGFQKCEIPVEVNLLGFAPFPEGHDKDKNLYNEQGWKEICDVLVVVQPQAEEIFREICLRDCE